MPRSDRDRHYKHDTHRPGNASHQTPLVVPGAIYTRFIDNKRVYAVCIAVAPQGNGKRRGYLMTLDEGPVTVVEGSEEFSAWARCKYEETVVKGKDGKGEDVVGDGYNTPSIIDSGSVYDQLAETQTDESKAAARERAERERRLQTLQAKGLA